ncbi:MAG TPA: cytochrome c biogenesis protein CcdA [Streptosporangiaceae bacterium]|nr:cytochrome c biogenesis protein CcdA [Streptosporangiaceae bacterium]
MSGGVGNLVISSPLILAVPIAAAAGAVNFLSPCVLPLVPGYLSYVTGMSGEDTQDSGPARRSARPSPGSGGAPSEAADTSVAAGAAETASATLTVQADHFPVPAARRRRSATLVGALLFILGFSVVFTSEGAAFGSLGLALRGHSVGVTQVLGGLTIALGLLFAGAFDRFTFAGRILRPSIRPRAGLAGAPLLGVLFGIGWTPCSGPTLTAVLTLAMTTGTAARGAVLMFFYSLGLGVPLLLLALAFQRGVAALGFARRHARLITRLGGAMLVAVGVLEVSGAWTSALAWLQVHWVLGSNSPL